MVPGIFPGDSEIQKTDLASVNLPTLNKITALWGRGQKGEIQQKRVTTRVATL